MQRSAIKWIHPKIVLDSVLESNSSVENISAGTKQSYFSFNPNSLDHTGWMRLGFSKKQAQSILNYRNAGAVFKVKTDLKKLFVINEEIYSELTPFILLPEELDLNRQTAISKPDRTEPVSEVRIIQLNIADTTSLRTLRGIGPYFARKIVEYRLQLGGYVSVDQLLEIWNMKEETVDAIRPFVRLDSSALCKISINQISTDSLRKHPYVSFSLARSLVAIREKHGAYLGPDDLKKSVLMSDSLMFRLVPYLHFE